ncbi:aquaporin [Coleophoma crateriformis]|uniref:Aquaporin n=1 Tax=Coleophoma crateriformis TaxID=565419 RepID=A0A3D8RP97_9HELO|nr:aquaporin [Coleophoma crateriformis]
MPSLTKRIQNHGVAFLGEFVGTFLFLFFAFAGAQTANQPSTQTANVTGPDLTQLLYISLIFGFSLAINVWVFFRISGGLFNPAVTLALCITGVVPIVRSVVVFIAQIVAGIAAAAAVKGLIPGNDVLFVVHLTSGTTVTQGLFLEMFFTVELVFTILMLAAELPLTCPPHQKTKATFIAPIGIGLALFVAELVGVFWTGGSVNPARAFGPAVIARSFDSYHWLYWIGPFLGSLLAAGFYRLMKALNYEDVNGDQDKSAGEEAEEKRKKRHHSHGHDRQRRGSMRREGVDMEMGHRPRSQRRSGEDRPISSSNGTAGNGHIGPVKTAYRITGWLGSELATPPSSTSPIEEEHLVASVFLSTTLAKETLPFNAPRA